MVNFTDWSVTASSLYMYKCTVLDYAALIVTLIVPMYTFIMYNAFMQEYIIFRESV